MTAKQPRDDPVIDGRRGTVAAEVGTKVSVDASTEIDADADAADELAAALQSGDDSDEENVKIGNVEPNTE